MSKRKGKRRRHGKAQAPVRVAVILEGGLASGFRRRGACTMQLTLRFTVIDRGSCFVSYIFTPFFRRGLWGFACKKLFLFAR